MGVRLFFFWEQFHVQGWARGGVFSSFFPGGDFLLSSSQNLSAFFQRACIPDEILCSPMQVFPSNVFFLLFAQNRKKRKKKKDGRPIIMSSVKKTAWKTS